MKKPASKAIHASPSSFWLGVTPNFRQQIFAATVQDPAFWSCSLHDAIMSRNVAWTAIFTPNHVSVSLYRGREPDYANRTARNMPLDGGDTRTIDLNCVTTSTNVSTSDHVVFSACSRTSVTHAINSDIAYWFSSVRGVGGTVDDHEVDGSAICWPQACSRAQSAATLGEELHLVHSWIMLNFLRVRVSIALPASVERLTFGSCVETRVFRCGLRTAT